MLRQLINIYSGCFRLFCLSVWECFQHLLICKYECYNCHWRFGLYSRIPYSLIEVFWFLIRFYHVKIVCQITLRGKKSKNIVLLSFNVSDISRMCFPFYRIYWGYVIFFSFFVSFNPVVRKMISLAQTLYERWCRERGRYFRWQNGQIQGRNWSTDLYF